MSIASTASFARLQHCHGLALAALLIAIYPLPSATAAAAKPSASELEGRCRSNDWSACADLALIYQNGQGVPKSLDSAAILFGKACNGGHGSACHALAVMYEEGQGVAPDAKRSAALLARACKLGDLHVCPSSAAAAASPANAPAAGSAATGSGNESCRVAKVLLGTDTVASVARDIAARGGNPASGSGLDKHRLSALSGDYGDIGQVMAVNYDFNSAEPSGKLTAITVVRHATSTPEFDRLLADRKAEIGKRVGPLQPKSATEFHATVTGCRLKLIADAGTWFIYEIYELPK